ncbi:MAG: N-formylglutamate amidohydrolase [Defluviimonas denitrificans]
MTISSLLGPRDPAPVEVLNPTGKAPLLLICEHAGQAVPARLSGLGVTQDQLDAHIGWDIGAAGVTRRLAKALDAPAVLQTYSRLVIDCNRPPEAADSMPEVSDGHVIPGNRGLTVADRQARIDEIFAPYQAAVADMLDRAPFRATVSIHSFTPRMNGFDRPWDIGFLFRRDEATSTRIARTLAAQAPELTIGMNQPYQVDDASDWFVPRIGEARGLCHSLIEIRNDHIRSSTGQALWADRLSHGLRPLIMEHLT